MSEEHSKKWPQYLAAITSSICAIGCGLHFGWLSPTLRLVRLRRFSLNVDTVQVTNVISAGPLGYIASSPFSMVFIDVLGRKKFLLFIAVPQILSWIIIANAKSFTGIYIAKVVAGAGEGALFSVLPTYLCEISQPSIRGHIGSIFTTFLVFGIFLINCYAPYLSTRNCAYISISVPVLFFITFITMPESPYFFIMKGRLDDARSSLKRLRHVDNVDQELEQLVTDVERQMSEKGSFKEIVTVKPNRKAFLILLGVRTLQQFSGYSAYSFYTDEIFKNVNYLDSNYSAVIYTGTHLIFIVIASLFLDSLGRRRLLIISIISVIVVLLGMGGYFVCLHYYKNDMYYFLWVPILIMVMYTLAFDFGLGIVPNLLTGELLSTRIKTKTLGIVIIYCSMLICASSKLFEWLETRFYIFVPFFFFCMCCLIGLPFIYYYIPETKGKSLEEIQQELGKH